MEKQRRDVCMRKKAHASGPGARAFVRLRTQSKEESDMTAVNSMTRRTRSQEAEHGDGRSRMPTRSYRYARDVGEGDWIATAMGLFSMGLGLSQVMAPGRMARCIGLRDEHQNRSMMRWI